MGKFLIPPSVAAVIAKIEENGFEAWLVGGCVRDMLRGVEPHDYDIASSAPCKAICGMFDRVIETGLKHGTVTVISENQPIEVTRYRIDGTYADHRRPDSVEFTADFREDLSRRDFTVNAIGYSVTRGLFDPFNGKDDIENGLLRTVGNPEKRFDEDALRIMRAVRFASTLGYKIEENTLKSVKELAPALKNVSAERIFSELKKTLCGDIPSLCEILINNGGLEHIGLHSCDDLSPIDRIDNSLNARLAALITLCNADKKEVMCRLKSDKVTRTAVWRLCDLLKPDIPTDRVSLKKYMSRVSVSDLTALLSAISCLFGVNTDKAKNELADIIERKEPYRIADLRIDGKVLGELNIFGKEVGDTLAFLLDRVIENPSLNTVDELKKLIDRH